MHAGAKAPFDHLPNWQIWAPLWSFLDGGLDTERSEVSECMVLDRTGVALTGSVTQKWWHDVAQSQ